MVRILVTSPGNIFNRLLTISFKLLLFLTRRWTSSSRQLNSFISCFPKKPVPPVIKIDIIDRLDYCYSKRYKLESPLLGGVRGGSLGREISVNISRITDLPTPKSPPKRGLSNSITGNYMIRSE